MSKSSRKNTPKRGRRKFLKAVAMGAGGLALPGSMAAVATGGGGKADSGASPAPASAPSNAIAYPRIFRDEQRRMLAFPLGGVGAGSISLGGRGDLRGGWIFN